MSKHLLKYPKRSGNPLVREVAKRFESMDVPLDMVGKWSVLALEPEVPKVFDDVVEAFDHAESLSTDGKTALIITADGELVGPGLRYLYVSTGVDE